MCFPQRKWALVSEINVEEAKSPVNSLINSLSIALVLISLLIIFASIFLSHTISKPIVRITKNIDAISQGKLTVLIDKKDRDRKDEIGALARSFDRTMVSLKLAVKHLKSHNKNTENKPKKQ